MPGVAPACNGLNSVVSNLNCFYTRRTNSETVPLGLTLVVCHKVRYDVVIGK